MRQISYDVSSETDIAAHMDQVADDMNLPDARPKMSEIRWALREGACEIRKLRAQLAEARAQRKE